MLIQVIFNMQLLDAVKDVDAIIVLTEWEERNNWIGRNLQINAQTCLDI